MHPVKFLYNQTLTIKFIYMLRKNLLIKRLNNYSLFNQVILKQVVCYLLLPIALLNSTLSYGQDTLAKWQTSWEQFVQTYNKCVIDPACKREDFLSKVVIWEGKVKKNDTTKNLIQLDIMTGTPIEDKVGTKSDLFDLQITPEIAQQANWKKVTKGQMVRFKAKMPKEVTFAGLIMYMDFGPGKKMAILAFDNGELIEVLPGN
jgi:hypothetical protein